MTEIDWAITIGAVPLVLSLSFNLIADGLVKLVKFDLIEALIKDIPSIINKIEVKEKNDEHI